MNTRVEFSTTAYQFAHGKMPRGTGHWGFFFNNSQDVDYCWFFNGTFADAKRAAMARAMTKGYFKVSVAS